MAPVHCAAGSDRRDELRRRPARCAPGRIVERVEVLRTDRRLRQGRPSHISEASAERCLLASALIRLASTAKPSPPTSPSAMQRSHGGLEQLAQEVAVAEAAVAVLREGGVIGHVAFEPEPAEPAVGEVQMHLVAQAPLGADAAAVADDQHPDHQLGIDRGRPVVAVERPQVSPYAAQVDEPIDRAKQMVSRHVTLQAELVEQRPGRLAAIPSCLTLPSLDRIESAKTALFNCQVFQQNRPTPDQQAWLVQRTVWPFFGRATA